MAPPQTVTVVFRLRARAGDRIGPDELSIAVQRRLFASGRAVLGRTRIDGRVAMKLTLINPTTTKEQIDRLLDLVIAEAAAVREESR